MQRARPRPSLPFASVSSTNGSSFEEILKELDVQYVFVVIIMTLYYFSFTLLNDIVHADRVYRLLAVNFPRVLLEVAVVDHSMSSQTTVVQ